MKKSSEEIITILTSLTKVSINDGELDVYFDGSDEACGVREFLPGSFTRELLEFIQDYMLESE